jgi:hypothetical protein
MNTGPLWHGGYTPITGSDNGLLCEIISASNSAIDSFEVFFVSPDRFVARKGGALYRFGMRI